MSTAIIATDAKVSKLFTFPSLIKQQQYYIYNSHISLRAGSITGLVSTGEEMILINNEMAAIKTNQKWVTIRIYGIQRIRLMHTSLENPKQLQLIQGKNQAVILQLLEHQREEQRDSLSAQSPVTESVVQSTA